MEKQQLSKPGKGIAGRVTVYAKALRGTLPDWENESFGDTDSDRVSVSHLIPQALHFSPEIERWWLPNPEVPGGQTPC